MRHPIPDDNTSWSKLRDFKAADVRAVLETEIGLPVGNMIFDTVEDRAHWRLIEVFRGFHTPNGTKWVEVSEDTQTIVLNNLTANAEPVGWFSK